MNVFSDINRITIKNPVLTVGFFDGVHIGHREIINQMKQKAKSIDGETVIFTFFPHPRTILYSNEVNLKLLNTIDEKIYLLEHCGLDNLIIYPFSKEFSKLTACQFIEEYLIKKINIRQLVVGYDHRFGHDREGNIDILRKCISNHNIFISQVEAFKNHGVEISSTKIRKLLENGEIETANQYLGTTYFCSGKVVEGKQIGRTIGFPTANIEIEDKTKLIPANGVYAVKIEIENKIFDGMLNIGFRPTISNSENKTIEVNIFEFNKDIYKKNIKLFFIKKLRDEKQFSHLDELKNQIHEDKKQIIKMLNNT